MIKIAEEKNFENKVVKPFLKRLPNCQFFKVHGSMFQESGIPDIIACINGKFVALELKAERGKPTALQLYKIEQYRKAGAYARVVKPSDWEEIRKELEKL